MEGWQAFLRRVKWLEDERSRTKGPLVVVVEGVVGVSGNGMDVRLPCVLVLFGVFQRIRVQGRVAFGMKSLQQRDAGIVYRCRDGG